jgi:hypothetical protein
MELKASYTIGDLASLAGMTARQVRALLNSNGVRLTLTGEGRKRRHRVVLLSELKESFPEFWASCVERARTAKHMEDALKHWVATDG